MPVLTSQVLEIFKDRDGLFIDCTLGFGGHTETLLNQHKNCKIIGIDKDIDAINFAKKRLKKYGIYALLESGFESTTLNTLQKNSDLQKAPLKDFKNLLEGFLNSESRVMIIRGAFSKVLEILKEHVNKHLNILADIGVSSFQLDSDRGFSFKGKRLDMRMDITQSTTAQSILLGYSEALLEKVFLEFGELRNAKKIARQIVQKRQSGSKFDTPQELNCALETSDKKLLALAYQALRIETNGELDELKALMKNIHNFTDSRVCVITFHSLEDRIVKNAFRNLCKSCICKEDAIKCTCGKNNSKGTLITKKPLVASKTETAKNPRANSAKLRAVHIK